MSIQRLESLLRTGAPLALVVLVSCGGNGGSADDGGISDAGDTIDSAVTIDAEVPQCTAAGMDCTTNEQCCTENCDPDLNLCTVKVIVCLEPDSDCELGPECCSFACVGGKCSSEQCTSDNDPCDSDGECCSGSCPAGSCLPLNPVCKTSGNACIDHDECCSEFCDGDFCSARPSYCTQTGDTCLNADECCGGICVIAQGASMGVCAVADAPGATQCMPAGEVCGGVYDGVSPLSCGGDCCSKFCGPYGPSGVLICQPPSGCHPTGELCQEDSDCCGGPGNPDNDPSNVTCSKDDGASVGRCDNGNACTPAGSICKLNDLSCSANANCCAGNTQNFDTCHPDSLGIPRCTVAEIECSDPSVYEGEPCASSADCCGLPCTPAGSGPDSPLLCGGACVDDGGVCTTSSDCCMGLNCQIPPGSTMGTCGTDTTTCAEYGQSCEVAEDCCNGIPCTNNICKTIIVD